METHWSGSWDNIAPNYLQWFAGDYFGFSIFKKSFSLYKHDELSLAFLLMLKSPPYKNAIFKCAFGHDLLSGSNKACPKCKFEQCISIWWALAIFHSMDFQTTSINVQLQWEINSVDVMISTLYWHHSKDTVLRVTTRNVVFLSMERDTISRGCLFPQTGNLEWICYHINSKSDEDREELCTDSYLSMFSPIIE